ncbi:MAG: ABC transporter permease, partial [Candidatus Aminicenantes bacterium]|nr:ABC transporter permease [Candidatus Aminicenantes bacterium]
MFKNYLLTAWRNIVRHKGYSLITIAGFALGLACCLMILLYILDETSYDRFYTNADRTYRIDVDASWADNTASMATVSAPLAALIQREIPEIEVVTRFRYYGAPVLRHGETCFSEERFFFADPAFFDVFSVPFIQGDPRRALAQPNAVAISLSMARKYFG